MKPIRTLVILARVTHYRYQGRLYAYTPYAREIEMWADLFPEVVIAGTCRCQPPPGDCTPFTRHNIKVCPITEAGGHGVSARLLQLFLLPRIVLQTLNCLRQADAVHARCPCDLGLLGLLFGPLFTRYVIAKYATQWLEFKGEPLAWRCQRWLLKSPWWRGPATVYGRWPNQPAKVVPFFSSALTDSQLARGQQAADRRRNPKLLRLLFVGRLSRSKNVDVLLRAMAEVNVPGCTLECSIVGEGPERPRLEQLARALGLDQRVVFTGGLPCEAVLDKYENADVLVLVSDIEGWPKAVAEAMAFGLVCVASERGLAPQMLAEGRGLIVPPRDVRALKDALEHLAANREASAEMARRALAWARGFSLESLRDGLRRIMAEQWSTEGRPHALVQLWRNQPRARGILHPKL